MHACNDHLPIELLTTVGLRSSLLPITIVTPTVLVSSAMLVWVCICNSYR